MKETGISQTRKHFDILIYAGSVDPDHPERSTLTLKLLEPYPVTDGVSAEVGKVDPSALKPGDKIEVKPGDVVTWIIQDPNISSILILHKIRGKNVFASGPAPARPGQSWTGIIRGVSMKEDEEYAICWSQGGVTYCYDPIIYVNP
jgi:hypothetical protein